MKNVVSRCIKILKPISLTKTMNILLMLWFILQVIIIIYWWGKPQNSDPKHYMEAAQNCFINGTWFPAALNLNAHYLHAPGFINFLILQLKVFGTMNINSILNLLMNLGIAAELYYLAN